MTNQKGIDMEEASRVNDVFANIRLDNKHRELTTAWAGRCIAAVTRETGQNIGKKTLHALKPRIEELHAMGLKAEQAGKILAHEYRMHSRMTKEKEALMGERDSALTQLRKLLETPPAKAPTPIQEPTQLKGYILKKGNTESESEDSFGNK